MIQEKWTLIQPSHNNGQLIPPNHPWSIDSFHNFSRQYHAKCYHINDHNIEMDSKIYQICSYDIGLIDKEIKFAQDAKARGAKISLGFSQDLRFLSGDSLMSRNGTLYTELCKEADVILSGCDPNLKVYGRYQDKVIPYGETLDPLNFSIPYNNRDIDLLISGTTNMMTIPFELELAHLVKEKYPDKKIMICMDTRHLDSILILRNRYPMFEFPSHIPLIQHMKRAKVYCNAEIRPRPGRALMEAYYCRVPFISASNTYFSRLCSEFMYNRADVVDMFTKYQLVLDSDVISIIANMENRAKFDMFDQVYARLSRALHLGTI